MQEESPRTTDVQQHIVYTGGREAGSRKIFLNI
jgi:hypothetical protein